VRCIGVLYSQPFENFISPHTTEYRYNGEHITTASKKQAQEAIRQVLEDTKHKEQIDLESFFFPKVVPGNED